MASQPGCSAAPPAAPPAGQQAEEPAGAEFFRRRLQRAMAIPPEQRDPAVHAFVTSVQLMHAADELLPLTADGLPALPADTLAGQQAEVQAMLLAATSACTAAMTTHWVGQAQDRLGCYMQRRLGQTAAVGGRLDTVYLPALQPLGKVLLMFLTGPRAPDSMKKIRTVAGALAVLMGAPHLGRAAVSQQLQQAQRGSPHQLLTVDQLEAGLHRLVARCGAELIIHRAAYVAQATGSPATEQGIAAATLASCDRLIELEPHSPGSLLVAALGCTAMIHASHPSSQPRQLQRVLDLHIRAFKAAQAMRSQYWTVDAGCRALLPALSPPASVSRADLESFVAAAEGAPAAIKQLCRVLPQSWIVQLQAATDAGIAMLPLARARLQGPGHTTAQQLATWGSILEGQASNPHRCVCSGCGKQALGLRRCAGCKQAAYCSRDCQVRHWLQHKHECKAPSGGSGDRA